MPLGKDMSMRKKTAYNPMLANSNQRSSPENFTPEEVQKFLSKFYLIKTKYGYVLGRNGGPNQRSVKRSDETPTSHIIEWTNLPSYKGKII